MIAISDLYQNAVELEVKKKFKSYAVSKNVFILHCGVLF